jgi:hypothetical protein
MAALAFKDRGVKPVMDEVPWDWLGTLVTRGIVETGGFCEWWACPAQRRTVIMRRLAVSTQSREKWRWMC